MATIQVNSGTIGAALKAAQKGDIIKMESGLYGRIVGPTSGLDLSEVTLDAEGAQIDGQLWFTRVNGVSVVGGIWTGGLRFDAPVGAKVEGIDARGDGGANSYGVFVNGGAKVHVLSSDFTGHKSGVALNKVDAFKIIGNNFRRSRNDCCSLYGVNGGRVAYNRFLDTSPVTADEHPDAVQLASLAGYIAQDITIERNIVRAKQSQGLCGFDGPFNRVIIQDNEVCVGFPHGIALYANEGVGSAVRRNQVSTWPGSRWQTGIDLKGNVERFGNSIEPHLSGTRLYAGIADPMPEAPEDLTAKYDALVAKLTAIREAAA
jgi:hypothetical protein